MSKNNQQNDQPRPRKNCPISFLAPTLVSRSVSSGASAGAGGGTTAFALKVVFVGMVLSGFALVARGYFKPLRKFETPPVNNSAKPKAVLTAKNSVAPNPSLLTIPSLKVTASFEFLGLNPDHTLEVPKNNTAVGWFIYGAKPGEMGASVIVGHLNSASGRAVFADLGKIKRGDKIFIERKDGSVVVYRVDSLSKFSQSNFPTKAVYGPVPYAGIRLITCSGKYDKKAGRYSDNLVVFGSKI